jgi:hypothetical protein
MIRIFGDQGRNLCLMSQGENARLVLPDDETVQGSPATAGRAIERAIMTARGATPRR